MRSILGYITDYFAGLNKRELFFTSLFTAILVFINYYFNLDNLIREKNSFAVKLLLWYAVFLSAFIIPYRIAVTFNAGRYFRKTAFIFLLLVSPLVFAFKISFDFTIPFTSDSSWNYYWNQIIFWPVLFVIIFILLFFICLRSTPESQEDKTLHGETSFRNKNILPMLGLSGKSLSLKPYYLMLLIMMPLVAAASTQPDFLAVYPKLKLVLSSDNINEIRWFHKLFFELSYGSDFFTIEMFFRGFLIVAFARWVGKDAILPMACFYCTIHFGKPLGECISSYFGGMILGIIVYNTRSIYGGLLVHLGIAWLMELGGYLGNYYLQN